MPGRCGAVRRCHRRVRHLAGAARRPARWRSSTSPIHPTDSSRSCGLRRRERRPIKGILAQKPIASTLADAIEIEKVCRESGKVLAVNQNMRYDQSMRALKTLLDGGHIGTPIVAQIVMNARPHWQEFIRGYGRIAILNMSIHHLDVYRFLFGEPERISRQRARRSELGLSARRRDRVLHPRVRGRPPRGWHRQLLHLDRPPDRVAGRGHRRDRQGHDRLAGLPVRKPLARSTTTSGPKRAPGTDHAGRSAGSRRRSRARWAS